MAASNPLPQPGGESWVRGPRRLGGAGNRCAGVVPSESIRLLRYPLTPTLSPEGGEGDS
jgi:hypothetical protein